MVHEKQVLQHLQDLQLGLCDDVYAAVLCQKKLYVEFAGFVGRAADPLGNHILSAPGTILRENK